MIKHCGSLVFALLLLCPVLLAAAESKPAREILGVRLGMDEKEAETRLKEIGQFVRKESHKQEVWKLPDNPTFSHLLIGLAKDGKLRYVTAVAREDKDAKPISYAEIGDPKEAKQAGDAKIKVYNYQWHLPAEKGEPETLVLAIGRDPEKLSTWSLKRLGATAKEKD